LSFVAPQILIAQEQESTAEENYHYTAPGKRDPFLPPFSTTAPETTTAAEEARTPLQRFDLGQLKLVGVIWATDEPKALIEDGGGLGYIVTRGTLIGSRGGVVKMIEPKRVVVEEYETDFFGKKQAQERELRLIVTDSAPTGKKKEK
jgi:type IV pilus assembly protein PilP